MAIRKEGAFFEIVLSNGKFSYGRVLPKANYAFYDIYEDQRLTDIKEIETREILFIISVYKFAITKNRWKQIASKELESKLQTLPLKFIEDILHPGNFELYNPNTGKTDSVTKDKCLGLERAAVWEPEHVEERIIDYFERRPNKWVEQLKLN